MEKIQPFHFFKYADCHCVINIENMAVAKIEDQYTIELLEVMFNNQKSTLSKKDNYFLKKYGLLNGYNVIQNEEADFIMEPIVNITLNVIQECNLCCVYCYGDKGKYGLGGKMTEETALKSVDWLIEQSKNKKELLIGFFGGEPMLNFSLIKKIVNYAQKRCSLKNKEIEFSINTNGTLLDNDVIKFLKENRIKILVSLDGSKEIQDKQRPFKNGKGSFDVITKNLKVLLKEIPGAACRATIMGDTCIENVDLAIKEIGFTKSHINFVTPSLFEETSEILNRNLNNILNAIKIEANELLTSIKEQKKNKIKEFKDSGQLMSIVTQLINSQSRLFPCGAGRGYVAISANGRVYLCHRFVGDETYKLGTINTDLERNEYLKSPVKRQSRCIECFAKYICGGGCYHDNLSNTGSIYKGSQDSCSLTQSVVELAAYITCQLNNVDKDFLVNENIIDKKPCLLDLL